MEEAKQALKQVLAKVSPSKSQRKQTEDIVKSFVKKLNSEISKQKIKANVFVGGSIAKDTWFANKTDVDVFVRFDLKKYANESQKLSERLEKILEIAFKKEEILRLHGSRDYFQLKYEELSFEVVPILDIKLAKEAMNITDVTPLHVKFVNEFGSKFKDDIRLAKQFAKAAKCYGAESFIGGFSGYVLEILVINYAGFQKFLEAASKWKEKTVVDFSNWHKGKDVFMEIDISKLNSPLIVVDPVDKYRNAAAALNLKKWKLFKSAAKKYLKNPSLKLFEKEKIDFEKLKKEASRKKLSLVYVELLGKKGKRDVIGCQLLKAFEILKHELDKFGVHKSDLDFEFEESNLPLAKLNLYLFLAKKKLPKQFEIKGPPVSMKEACSNFKKAHGAKVVSEKKGILVAKKDYEICGLKAFVENVLSSKLFKPKIKKVLLAKIF